MRRPASAAVARGSAGATVKRQIPTPYESRVYELCRLIPCGKVTTYGDMAKVLQSSARAVGQAMRRNTFAPVVPCHRVVASDLGLGGFSGSWGPECSTVKRKKSMLEGEGVTITGNSVHSTCRVSADGLRKLLQEAQQKLKQDAPQA